MANERKHALLSASSAKKWINCPASARLEETLPDTTSEFAEEGTLAHELCELKLRRLFVESSMADKEYKAKWFTIKKNPLYKSEMEHYTDRYVDYVKDIAFKYDTAPYIAIEKRVDYSHIAKEGFGTSDCIILSGEDCHIIDFKYGKGVSVSAEGNYQLGLYALGVLAAYGCFYPMKSISFHIVQPRVRNVSSWSTTLEELTKWGETYVKPKADLAYDGSGRRNSGTWCEEGFCKAAPLCRQRKESFMELEASRDSMTETFKLPPLLTNDKVGEILERAQKLSAWVKKLEAYALSELTKGNDITGWKIVEGRSNRVITDLDVAYDALVKAGYKKALFYDKVPISLTNAEALISKGDYNEVLAHFIEKPKGAPTLALATDKRPVYELHTSAEDDFGGTNNYKEEKEVC